MLQLYIHNLHYKYIRHTHYTKTAVAACAQARPVYIYIYIYTAYYIHLYIRVSCVCVCIYTHVWSQDYNARCVCERCTPPRPRRTRLLPGWVMSGPHEGRGSSCGVCTVVCEQKVIAAFIYYYYFFFNCSYFPSSSRVDIYTYIYIYLHDTLTITRRHERARGSLRTVAGSIRKSTVPIPFNVYYTYIYIHTNRTNRTTAHRAGPLNAQCTRTHFVAIAPYNNNTYYTI